MRNKHPFIFTLLLFFVTAFTTTFVYNYVDLVHQNNKLSIMIDGAIFKAKYLDLENRLLIIRARGLENENEVLRSRSCQKFGMTEI